VGPVSKRGEAPAFHGETQSRHHSEERGKKRRLWPGLAEKGQADRYGRKKEKERPFLPGRGNLKEKGGGSSCSRDPFSLSERGERGEKAPAVCNPSMVEG